MKNYAFTVASLTWMTALIYLSLYRPSTSSSGHLFPHSDKVAHSVCYAILYGLLFFSFHNELKRSSPQVLAVSLAFLLGVLLEALQGILTAYRSPSLADVFSNGAGIIMSFLIIKYKKTSL